MKKVSFENLKGLQRRDSGLTEAEIIRQRSRHGNNEIVEVADNPWLGLAKDTLKDPMIWFLVGIGVIFILVGNPSEAMVLFLAIIPLTLMDAILHWRTQASTSSLRGQLASVVTVTRQSQQIQIDSRELVPGDIVLVSSGLFLPADGIFENAVGLQIDESVLTGEAFPIQKQNVLFDPFELVEAGEVAVSPSVLGFAGTRVLTGQGKMRVLFTGINTAYGDIVQSVAAMPHERTPLQKAIAKLVQRLILTAGVFCLLLAGVRLSQGHGWLDAFLSAATLAIAAIPEEFPIVFTFYLGVGIYRLAKRRALVRRAVSIENIGRVTSICTDKTGTLTVGQLKLTHLVPDGEFTELDVLKTSLAASNPSGSDPVDLAIQDIALKRGVSIGNRLQIFPFTEDRKRETVFISNQEKALVAYMKGSLEKVLSYTNLSQGERENWLQKASMLAAEGHKVLACSQRTLTPMEVDQKVEPESDFQFCGLLAFEDPPRPEVAGAMDYCKENSIRVLMLTGDHAMTAVAIARNVGLGGSSPVVCSAEEEPEKLQLDWLKQNPSFLKELDIVARCTPMQKLNIIWALQQQGELVAVTGDGVNDVPALKAADIGIAMGERGTRSAKEVSSIILADDNFKTIVSAIMEGRQLFLNLKMSFEYLLLFHIPFVLTAALVPLLGYPLLYLPIHIVWLELIIHPTALFAFQQETSVGKQKPRGQKDFFSRRQTTRITFFGLAVTGAIVLIHYLDLRERANVDHARSWVLALMTLWSAGLVLHFTRLKTRTAVAIFIITILSSLFLIQTKWLAKPLHLSSLTIWEWAVTVLFIGGFLLLMNAEKWVARSKLGANCSK